jgi:hypothetical protein
MRGKPIQYTEDGFPVLFVVYMINQSDISRDQRKTLLNPDRPIDIFGPGEIPTAVVVFPESPDKKVRVRLSDLLGNTIREETHPHPEYKLYLSWPDLSTGTYEVSVTLGGFTFDKQMGKGNF